MKTQPMEHQKTGVNLLARNPDFFGLGAEQGTGKTWMLLCEMEWRHSRGEISGGLVIAPNGVHTNWVKREIPTHLSCEYRAAAYKSGAGVKLTRQCDALCEPSSKLAILAMSYDAVNTKKGFELAERFLAAHKNVMILDESHNIKNLKAARTKKCIALGLQANSRRIATGTIMDKPVDVFAQFEFLRPEGKLLGTDSYHAFVSEFASVLPSHHPLVQHIVRKLPANKRRFTPQIIERDAKNMPVWRNLDRLAELMSPFIFRVEKADCLDLPDKVYQTVFYDLTKEQRTAYDKMRKEYKLQLGGEAQSFDKLHAKGTKLQQIASGFVIDENGTVHNIVEPGKNPKRARLAELLEQFDQRQVIVWSVYKEELRQIEELAAELEIPAVSYHGDVSQTDRDEAIDSFQRGDARLFIANPTSAGEGLTLTGATISIYYSNSYRLISRSQSEDRNHRKGTTEKCTYIDLVGENTHDEKVVEALQFKGDVAAALMEGIKDD